MTGPNATLPPDAAPPLLRIDDLKVWFPIRGGLLRNRSVGSIRAVDGVSFQIGAGEVLGLVGESGCGKSTTGRAILGLTPLTSGTVEVNGLRTDRLSGASLRRLRRQMQMIFQDPYSSLNPRMSVADIVREPLDIFAIGTSAERRERVRDLLSTVGLSANAARRYPHEFSGGQRQRIGIARALALKPDLIVADEPVSALDVSIQAQIVNLLGELRQEFGLTYLFIAHDLSIVRYVSDRIAVMYLGQIAEISRSDAAPLHPYTVALRSAIPIPDPVRESKRRRIILRGDVPSPAAPPTGCRFHTRCWLRERLGNPERCATDEPSLRSMGPDHGVACHFAEQLLPENAATPSKMDAVPDASGSTREEVTH